MPLTVQSVVILMIDVNAWVSHTHNEAVEKLRRGSALGCFHLSYSVHRGFAFGSAPFVGRHPVVVSIVHQGFITLRQSDSFHS
jgi:hypothetical protein